MKDSFRFGDRIYEIELHPKSGGWLVRTDDVEVEVQVRSLPAGEMELATPDRTVRLHTAPDGDTRWIALHGRTYELRRANRAKGRRGAEAPGSEGALRAPMPGQVRTVNVRAGETVTKGQTLMLLEAMKMEIRVQAPFDGAVTAVHAVGGEQVEREQVLIEIE